MQNRRTELLSALKWPALAAVLVAAGLAVLSPRDQARSTAPAERVTEAASRDAMRNLREGHDRVLDQADRQRALSEQKAAEDAHAFEIARRAAAEEAARKEREETARRLAEQRAAEQRIAEQRASEMKRVAEASPVRETRKPNPEPVVAGPPLDIAPPPRKPQNPIEAVVMKVGDVAGDIKNTAVSTVTGIKDWFAATGDKLLGRDRAPSSRFLTSW
jgi:hypothetical protein